MCQNSNKGRSQLHPVEYLNNVQHVFCDFCCYTAVTFLLLNELFTSNVIFHWKFCMYVKKCLDFLKIAVPMYDRFSFYPAVRLFGASWLITMRAPLNYLRMGHLPIHSVMDHTEWILFLSSCIGELECDTCKGCIYKYVWFTFTQPECVHNRKHIYNRFYQGSKLTFITNCNVCYYGTVL